MARARNIKPALFKNEVLGVEDPHLTILYTGLWCLADREGRLEDRPLRIKGEIFPYRDGLDVNGYLTELERLGFIDRYEVSQQKIIQVRTFSEHQNPHKTEKQSVLPEKPITSASQDITVKAPLKDGEITEAARLIPDSLNTDSLNLIPDPLITDQSTMATPGDFLKRLVTTHGYDERQVRTKTQNTTQAKQWLSDGVTPLELDNAVEVARAQFSSSGDDHDPPIGYLAKVLASNRKQGKAVAAGNSNHTGFTADRYAIDDTARRFKIAGVES